MTGAKSNKFWLPILFMAAVLMFITYTVWAAGGVRGTDQYWYMAHVESIIDGSGVTDNNIYPVSVYDEVATLPRPFVHNILNVYLVAPMGLVLGAYNGWIVTNIVAALLTSIVIFLAVRRYADWIYALAAAWAYLFMPLTLWHTPQPLAEATMAPLVALVVLVYTSQSKDRRHWILLVVLSGLLVLCRKNFLLLLFCIPIAYLVYVRPVSRGNLAFTGLMLLMAVLFAWFPGRFMEPNVTRSLQEYLMFGVPGKIHNDPFFSINGIVFSLGDLLSKVLQSFRQQFVNYNAMSTLLFYTPFNIMYCLLFIMARKKHLGSTYFIAAAFALFLHMATIAVFQNPARYLLPLMPAALVANAIIVAQYDSLTVRRYVKIFIVAIVISGSLTGFMFANHLRKQGADQRQYRHGIEQSANRIIGKDHAVILDANSVHYLLMGYALRPRPVLMVQDYYEKNQYAILIKNVGARWLICSTDSKLPELLGAGLKQVSDATMLHNNLAIYRLPPSY